MGEWFNKVSNKVAELTGHVMTFVIALLIIIVWAISGPIFKFSETWQLVINTGTTIITFLMVFLIQNTQNRDAKAVHLKLDELIRSIEQADNELISAEDETDAELRDLKAKYDELVAHHDKLLAHHDKVKQELVHLRESSGKQAPASDEEDESEV
jgi:low affinity Fe/Cu permease